MSLQGVTGRHAKRGFVVKSFREEGKREREIGGVEKRGLHGEYFNTKNIPIGLGSIPGVDQQTNTHTRARTHKHKGISRTISSTASLALTRQTVGWWVKLIQICEDSLGIWLTNWSLVNLLRWSNQSLCHLLSYTQALLCFKTNNKVQTEEIWEII